jgi:hypothetical protein
MRPLLLLLALVLLAACAPRPKLEAAPEPAAAETDCTPGDDDGIGGTGCQVD